MFLNLQFEIIKLIPSSILSIYSKCVYLFFILFNLFWIHCWKSPWSIQQVCLEVNFLNSLFFFLSFFYYSICLYVNCACLWIKIAKLSNYLCHNRPIWFQIVFKSVLFLKTKEWFLNLNSSSLLNFISINSKNYHDWIWDCGHFFALFILCTLVALLWLFLSIGMFNCVLSSYCICFQYTFWPSNPLH